MEKSFYNNGMKVRIYKPSKNTMQSGLGRTKGWTLECETSAARGVEPLMGWSSAGDTKAQVKLNFASQEAAIAYAQSQGWEYSVDVAHQRIVKPRNYADNFRYAPPEEASGR